MASRRSKKQDPIEAVWGFVGLVVVCLFLPVGATVKIHLTLWALFLVGLAVAFKLLPRMIQEQRFRGLQLDDVDGMDGRTFEHYVAKLLQSQGYKTTVTQASGDLGVDIVAERDGVRYAIQCKRYSNQIPRTAVSDAVAGAAHYRCTEMMVVTNNYFPAGAVQLARANRCTLVDRNGLAQWVTQYQAGTSGVRRVAGR
ncbi:MAG: putative endonuclease distantly related to archaeal Holliday junction resolvase and Mrr-like [Chthonomonadaceae bacterium]|nr:putative endonuclease distantly related to archaeal Holliday junction resolvase and Mrr-like [Chthonomonadaceae bacterium]